MFADDLPAIIVLKKGGLPFMLSSRAASPSGNYFRLCRLFEGLQQPPLIGMSNRPNVLNVPEIVTRIATTPHVALNGDLVLPHPQHLRNDPSLSRRAIPRVVRTEQVLPLSIRLWRIAVQEHEVANLDFDALGSNHVFKSD